MLHLDLSNVTPFLPSGWRTGEEKGLEKEFLQFCIGSSVLLTDSIPEWEAYTTTSKVQVVTLSTCTGRGHTTRWVVQGYLVQKYFKT